MHKVWCAKVHPLQTSRVVTQVGRRSVIMDADLHLEATSALRAGMLLTKEQMAALRAAAYPSLTPKRAPNPSIIVTPPKRSRLG